jgi:replicative DNA helicase
MRKKRDTTIDLTNTVVYGKVPPQAKDLEEIILGGCMLESNVFDSVATILKQESFYVNSHQLIFKAIVSLSLKSQPIDIMTVVEQLRTSEELDLVGGAYYVTKLTEKVSNTGNIETYCRIIHEKYLKRQLIAVCGEGLSQSYEDSTDAFELLDSLSLNVTKLAVAGTTDAGQDMSTLGVKRVQYLEEMRNREIEEVIGVPTGFRNINETTNGWIPTDLIILAARPSVGKTALALNLARNAAADLKKPTPVAFFCLEMNEEKLYDRLLSAESGISLEKITKARLSDDEMVRLYHNGVAQLANYPILLEYCPSLNIIELRAKARRWLQRVGGFGLIIIDYLQLMTGVRDDLNSQNREQELANISRSLKVLAGEMKVPIIALSQMSREIEKRGGGKPKLSDIRESGAIEQDADVVAFLTRLDYEMADHEVTQNEKDKALITFKKNRQGKLDTLPMQTVLEVQRWMTLEQYETYKNNTIQLNGSNYRRIDEPKTKHLIDEEDPF